MVTTQIIYKRQKHNSQTRRRNSNEANRKCIGIIWNQNHKDNTRNKEQSADYHKTSSNTIITSTSASSTATTPRTTTRNIHRRRRFLWLIRYSRRRNICLLFVIVLTTPIVFVVNKGCLVTHCLKKFACRQNCKFQTICQTTLTKNDICRSFV